MPPHHETAAVGVFGRAQSLGGGDDAPDVLAILRGVRDGMLF